MCVCCFVLLNRFLGIVTVQGSCLCRGPGVAGSSPFTLTTSLATQVPSSSSSNVACMFVRSVKRRGAVKPANRTKERPELEILENGEFATCDQNEKFSKTEKYRDSQNTKIANKNTQNQNCPRTRQSVEKTKASQEKQKQNREQNRSKSEILALTGEEVE